jgi:ribosomal protein S18 acetylase RimI-like enzyme
MMISNLEFRIGTIDDFEELKRIGEISFGKYKTVLTPENWQKLSDGIQNNDRLRALISISKIFVCEFEKKMIGAAYLVPNGHPEGVFEKGWAVIRRVGVDPAFEGRGIARQLTQMCIDHAKASGEKIIALHTSEFMHAARHIYESLGFKIDREIDPLFGKRYWLYLKEQDK